MSKSEESTDLRRTLRGLREYGGGGDSPKSTQKDTMNGKHTPGRLVADGSTLRREGEKIALLGGRFKLLDRLAKCHNACIGLSDPERQVGEMRGVLATIAEWANDGLASHATQGATLVRIQQAASALLAELEREG